MITANDNLYLDAYLHIFYKYIKMPLYVNLHLLLLCSHNKLLLNKLVKAS